jgi:hypothetical protein
MSFPASVYPSDYASYKQKYIDMLNIQIANDKKIYDAVTLKDRTGQLPITPPDYRSIEEKFADVLGLQRKLTTELATLTDAKNLAQIMNDLLKNPPLMNFVLMSMPTISEYMKKNYAQGVKYPIFIAYVEKLYNETEQKIGITSDERVAFINKAVTPELLEELRDEIIAYRHMTAMNKNNLVQVIDKLVSVMFTREELDKLNLKPPTITLTNAMLEAYKKLPQTTTTDPLQDIQEMINDLGGMGVGDEDTFTQNLFNLLDDAYLAISMIRSGVEFNTPALAQQKLNAKIEADRIEAERLQKIKDEILKQENEKKASNLIKKSLKSKSKSKTTAVPKATLTTTTVPSTSSSAPNYETDPAVIQTFLEDVVVNRANLINFALRNGLERKYNKNTVDAPLFYKKNNDPARNIIIQNILADLHARGAPVDCNIKDLSATAFTSASLPTSGVLLTSSLKSAGVAPPIVVHAVTPTGRGLAGSTQSRFDILKGEVLAGNNSKVLINELKRMIHKLVQDGTLNYSDAMNAIDDLNNI